MNRPMPTHTRSNTAYGPPNDRGHWPPDISTVYVLERTNKIGAGRKPLPLDPSRKL